MIDNPLDISETDEMLVDRCRVRRDDSAFEELIGRHRDQLFRLAISILGPEFAPEAEDVVQEVFLRVHLSLESFRGDSKFSSWVYRIAYNFAVSQKSRVRYRKRHLSDQAFVGVTTTDGNPVDAMADRQRAEVLEECIDKLPEVYQSALRLHYWMGNSMKTIAELLNVPENTVKSYLHRARKLLSALLKERGFQNE